MYLLSALAAGLVSRAHSVTLTALLKVNRQIKNPNRIAVGERVKLP